MDFKDDRRQLLTVLNRDCDGRRDLSIPHPFFVRLTRAEWLRWGCLQADHHLRQFAR
jgi:hypothetical protein